MILHLFVYFLQNKYIFYNILKIYFYILVLMIKIRYQFLFNK